MYVRDRAMKMETHRRPTENVVNGRKSQAGKEGETGMEGGRGKGRYRHSETGES